VPCYVQANEKIEIRSLRSALAMPIQSAVHRYPGCALILVGWSANKK